MQRAARSERMRVWRKRALLIAFVASSGTGLIAASTTYVAQSPIGSADRLGTLSKGTGATPVVIVDAKKCEDEASPGPTLGPIPSNGHGNKSANISTSISTSLRRTVSPIKRWARIGLSTT
jgi:hypothetical protein